MAILKFHRHQKLLRARRFFFEEFRKDKRDRMKHPAHIQTALTFHHIHFYRAFKELGFKMAKKNKSFKWQGYVNVNIPEAGIDAAEDYMADEKTVFFDFNQAIIAGYRIAINFQHDDESYRATMTCYAEDDENHGYAMSAWGGDWITAVSALLYKHFHLTDGNWQDYKTPTGRRFG